MNKEKTDDSGCLFLIAAIAIVFFFFNTLNNHEKRIVDLEQKVDHLEKRLQDELPHGQGRESDPAKVKGNG